MNVGYSSTYFWFWLVILHTTVRCHDAKRVRGKRKDADQPQNRVGETDSDLHDEARTNAGSSPKQTRFVIEGVSLSEARCQNCREDVKAEQNYILRTLFDIFGEPNINFAYRDTYLVNVQFVHITSPLSIITIQRMVLSIPGVRNVGESRDLKIDQQQQQQPNDPLRGPTTFDVADDYVDAKMARREYCVSGKGIRVAVIDTGVDYTHSLLGGNGTMEAFAAAYGADASSTENTRRDGLFPTARVVDGYDFVGDRSTILDIKTDEDPIDYPGGHGTRVASCLLAVAPDVEVLAVKVCSIAGCPEYSVLAGISFAVQRGARVINLSMGTPYIDSYYSVLSRAAEEAYEHGVVVVVSAGNHGNIPLVMGDFASTNNAITVGATDTSARKGYMTTFSSRGLADGVRLKPDFSAPGGNMLAAAAGSGVGVMSTSGTSFSCPFASGAAALLLERCPECSPFAVKALLMNSAARNIKYHLGKDIAAPLSWSGNGELQIMQSLSAGLWAYSVQDVQPSFSLGLINAFEDVTINRTLRLRKLLDEELLVTIRVQYRDPAMSDVLKVQVEKTSLHWSSPCGDKTDIDISFIVSAIRAPDNYLTSSGRAANDPKNLDALEFDGWIVIEYISTNRMMTEHTKDISVPFHSVIRKASDLMLMDNKALPHIHKGTRDINVDLFNNGIGTAQVDVFELLYVSEDDPEAKEGSDKPSADFNYIGYRSLPGGRPGCDYVLEFAFHLWEKHRRLVQTQLRVHFDIDLDNQTDYHLANRGQEYDDTEVSECRILKAGETVWKCTGFAPDHGTNSATTILRTCSNDVGIDNTQNRTINISFASYGYPNERVAADEIGFISIRVPAPILSAPSYDVPGGNALMAISVTATENITADMVDKPVGLLLVTNGWRSHDRTGSATEKSEVVALTFRGEPLPHEKTPDVLIYPVATDLSGPGCTWSDKPKPCDLRRELEVEHNVLSDWSDVEETPVPSRHLEVCNENSIPRSAVRALPPWELISSTTHTPSMSPLSLPSQSPSLAPYSPTLIPTSTPSTHPTVLPTALPSEGPSPFPSVVPTSVPTHLPTPAPTDVPSDTPSRTHSHPPSESPSGSQSDPPIDPPSSGILRADERDDPLISSDCVRPSLAAFILSGATVLLSL